MFDPLPADLSTALTAAAGRLDGFAGLHFRHEAGSTNDLAVSLARAGRPEGTAVLADLQTAGRGRRGRDWFSPPGAGIYLSMLMRPRDDERGPALVTIGAGVAVAEAVHAVTGLPVELKWPNDLVIGQPWRKLGGVLCEATGTGERAEAIVVGVGLNLERAVYPREIAGRATSIEIELGRPIERAPLVVELLARLTSMLRELHAGEREAIRTRWRRWGRAGLGNAAVRWTERGGVRRGRARDLDLDGALIVETEGRVERLVSGEVAWESMSSD